MPTRDYGIGGVRRRDHLLLCLTENLSSGGWEGVKMLDFFLSDISTCLYTFGVDELLSSVLLTQRLTLLEP